MENELLQEGEVINLIAKPCSTFHPELIPQHLQNDPLINGEKSLRVFCQDELTPKDGGIYQGKISEISITKEKTEGGVKIYIHLIEIKELIAVNRLNFVIHNKRRKKRCGDNPFFIWDSKQGELKNE